MIGTLFDNLFVWVALFILFLIKVIYSYLKYRKKKGKQDES